jgi:hypothetical protein
LGLATRRSRRELARLAQRRNLGVVLIITAQHQSDETTKTDEP